jgi:hypothetical protein
MDLLGDRAGHPDKARFSFRSYLTFPERDVSAPEPRSVACPGESGRGE